MVTASTEKKILTSNATIKFKLNNLVKIVNHKNLNFNRICFNNKFYSKKGQD